LYNKDNDTKEGIMNEKSKGILTAVASGILLFILNIAALIAGLVITDGGWGTVAVVIVMLAITGIVMIGLLIYGVVKHQQNQQDFGLGLIYGVGILLASSVLFLIFTILIGMFNI
jgi:hypothetical protein